MNNSIESVALFFSAADLGVCLVPLNPTLPLESIKVAMKSGDMKHLIARKSFPERMREERWSGRAWHHRMPRRRV